MTNCTEIDLKKSQLKIALCKIHTHLQVSSHHPACFTWIFFVSIALHWLCLWGEKKDMFSWGSSSPLCLLGSSQQPCWSKFSSKVQSSAPGYESVKEAFRVERVMALPADLCGKNMWPCITGPGNWGKVKQVVGDEILTLQGEERALLTGQLPHNFLNQLPPLNKVWIDSAFGTVNKWYHSKWINCARTPDLGCLLEPSHCFAVRDSSEQATAFSEPRWAWRAHGRDGNWATYIGQQWNKREWLCFNSCNFSYQCLKSKKFF